MRGGQPILGGFLPPAQNRFGLQTTKNIYVFWFATRQIKNRKKGFGFFAPVKKNAIVNLLLTSDHKNVRLKKAVALRQLRFFGLREVRGRSFFLPAPKSVIIFCVSGSRPSKQKTAFNKKAVLVLISKCVFTLLPKLNKSDHREHKKHVRVN